MLAPLTLFKVVLMPLIMAGATWLSRRLGAGIGGWIAGLPLTSAPISVFLVLQHDRAFAASAAVGTMSGSASAALFCLAYGFSARRFRWPVCIALALGAFSVGTLLVQRLSPGLWATAALVLVVGAAAVRWVPRAQFPAAAVVPPWWDIPLRMTLATGFVLLITGLSEALGAQWSGLLSPIPIYSSLMAIFAHSQQGPDGALRVLRGVALGTFAFASFFVVVGLTVTDWPLLATFGSSAVTAMAINAALFNAARR